MTIEEALEVDVEVLIAMSPADIEKHFSQYLDVTRPERVKKKEEEKPIVYLSPQKQAALAALQAENPDLDFLAALRKKKK